MSKIYNVITLIMRFMKKIGRDRVRAHAAEAAFFIIMSVFPILMLLLTLLRYTTLTTEQIIFTIEEFDSVCDHAGASAGSRQHFQSVNRTGSMDCAGRGVDSRKRNFGAV